MFAAKLQGHLGRFWASLEITLEIIFAFIGLIVALPAWRTWYGDASRIKLLRSGAFLRWLMIALPLVCLGLIIWVLTRYAAHDVRDDPFYVVIYAILGVGWLGLAVFAMPFAGILMRDDVLERNNLAPAYALAGALLGVTLCFAGSNIGDGPGAEVVIFSAGLATLAFFGLWLTFERLTRLSDRVTIERDPGAGMRLGSWLLAIRLVLGRAVAGNWESVDTTLSDFVHAGWFAAILWLLAILWERLLLPSVQRITRPFDPSSVPLSQVAAWLTGGALGALYVAAAGVWVASRGGW